MTPASPKLARKELLEQKFMSKLADIPYPINMVHIFRNLVAALEVSQQAIAINAKVI